MAKNSAYHWSAEPDVGSISTCLAVIDAREAAVESIRMNTRFTVGDGGTAHRIPVVLETASDKESRDQLRWAESLEGVAKVEVAFVEVCDVTGHDRKPGSISHGC